MDLHRTNKVADWQQIAPAKRNGWQRLAARTRGVVAPANIVSVAGAALTALGLAYIGHGRHTAGIWLIIVGRAADVADGMVAAHTGTKSPLGEALDAVLDKFVAALALIVFAVKGWLPLALVVLLAVHTLANIACSFLGKLRHKELHPSALGKIGAALQWGMLLGFGVAFVMHGRWHAALLAGAYTLAVPALACSYLATIQYSRQIAGR